MLSPWIRLGATPSSRDQFLDKIEMIGSARRVEGPFACYNHRGFRASHGYDEMTKHSREEFVLVSIRLA